MADLRETENASEDDTTGSHFKAQVALLTNTHTLLTNCAGFKGATWKQVQSTWEDLKPYCSEDAVEGDTEPAGTFRDSLFAYKTAVQNALKAASDNGSYDESLEQAKKLVALVMDMDAGTAGVGAFAEALSIASQSISTKNQQIKELKSEIRSTHNQHQRSNWTYAVMGIAALAAMSFGNSQRCNSALDEVSDVALVEAAKASQLCQSSVKDIASQRPGFNTGGLHLPIFPVFTTGSDADTITLEPGSVPTVTGAPKTG